MSKLGDYVRLVGGNGFPEIFQGQTSGRYPFIKVSDMNLKGNEKYITVSNNYVDENLLITLSLNLIPKGACIFAKVGAAIYLNRRRILTKETIIDNNLMAAIPLNINGDFLYYFLQTIDFAYTLQPGALPSLSSKIVSELKLLPPSLSEQCQIASILSTCDTVIEKTQSAIAKYKAIKQGMLHDLFTRGIDASTGKLRPRYKDAPALYKESKLGWIPHEWKTKQLDEITDYVDYRGKTPPKSEFGIYLVTARNIREGFIDYEISKEYIKEDAYESAMSRGKVKIGDVLITTEAPMGNVAQIDKENIALAQRVIKYRGYYSELKNDFLAQFLMSDNFQRQLMAEATGSTVLGIKGSRLHKLRIIIPKVKEQEIICKRIESINNKLQAEQNYIHKLKYIKAGLMSDLLSGKKIVPAPKES